MKYHVNTKVHFIVCLSEQRFAILWLVTWVVVKKNATNGGKGEGASKKNIFAMTLFLNDPIQILNKTRKFRKFCLTFPMYLDYFKLFESALLSEECVACGFSYTFVMQQVAIDIMM